MKWKKGKKVTRLTEDEGNDSDPAWSPDSKTIAFTSDRDGNSEIYRMDASKGKKVQRLTENKAEDIQPSWSPDAQNIVFVSERYGNFEISSMTAKKGKDLNRLTDESSPDSQPSWLYSVVDRPISALQSKTPKAQKSSSLDSKDTPAAEPDGSTYNLNINGYLVSPGESLVPIDNGYVSVSPAFSESVDGYTKGQVVTLVAFTDEDGQSVGWGGVDTRSRTLAMVSMNGDRDVEVSIRDASDVTGTTSREPVYIIVTVPAQVSTERIIEKTETIIDKTETIIEKIETKIVVVEVEKEGDNEPPVVTVDPVELTIYSLSDRISADDNPDLSKWLGSAWADDDIDDDALDVKSYPPDSFGTGTTTVRFSATDSSGNEGYAYGHVNLVPWYSMIAYVSEDTPGGEKGIYFTDPEGSHVRPVTLAGSDTDTEVRGGTWSVDGSMYAFASNHLGTYGIYVIDVKDGTIEEVANIGGVEENWQVSWSVFGRLAWESDSGGNYDIYVATKDDYGDWKTVNWTPGSESSDYRDPAWSLNGSSLAFSSNRSGDFDIYVTDSPVDGEITDRKTQDDAGDDRYPA
jgi:Tol biopolymer transport system component